MAADHKAKINPLPIGMRDPVTLVCLQQIVESGLDAFGRHMCWALDEASTGRPMDRAQEERWLRLGLLDEPYARKERDQ